MASSVELGIDFSTSNLIIYERDRGIVFDEPAVIAFNNSTHQILAFGHEANEMIGRTPSDIFAFRPLQRGNIENFDMTAELLRSAVAKALKKKGMFNRPKAIISFPTPVNERDQSELIRILYDLGMRRTQIMDRAIAASLGAGIPLDSTGKLLVDISGGITDITILTAQRNVFQENSNSLDRAVSGDSFTNAIIGEINGKYGFLIDERTAERLKIEIGNVLPIQNPPHLDVYGRNTITGLPKQMQIKGSDIYSALQIPLDLLCDFIQRALTKTSAEYSSDIYKNGFFLTGGGSMLGGLDHAIADRLSVKTTVSNTPKYDVVLGLGYALENQSEARQYLQYIRGGHISN